MLKKYGVRLTFAQFIRYGSAVAIPALAAAILGVVIL